LTYLSLKSKSYILVLAISALLVGSLVAPAAAREYSIWEWWTDQAMDVTDTNPIHPPWGAAYSAYTHDQVWDQQDIVTIGTHRETWVIPTAPFTNGQTTLRVEYAGWASANTFGWYNADGMNEIFDGSATEGDVALIDFSAATSPIGFYMTNGDGVTWYSEAASNTDTSTHVRVFDDVVTSDSWILAWEDKPMTTTEPVVYNYADAWDETKEPLKWYHELQKEPDYNDMILTFSWEERPKTPELSTVVLLGLSLAGLPVVLRRRRRS